MPSRFARFSLAIFQIDRCRHKLAAKEMAKYEQNSSHTVYLPTMHDDGKGICGKNTSVRL